jgi:predicted TIM-barrel fold metal-dependent hydrolase
MLTRRMAIAGAAAAGTLTAAAAPAASITPPDFAVPEPACDCHQHIIGDPVRFPMVPTRTYTPPQAPLSALQALHRALKIQRAVLVQPSFYGTDNACLLDALRQLGASGRGIVVIDDKTPEATLDQMARLGARGVRINQTGGLHDPAALKQVIQATSNRIASRGWHVQTFLPLDAIAALQSTFAALPTPIVFDHFGGATAAGTKQPGFDALCDLLKGGNCYVKLSAPYHASNNAPTYPEITPLARALIAARVDRLIWGSDWPHTNSDVPPGHTPQDINPFYKVDNGKLFNLLPVWAPDPAARRQILVNNPTRLFGF